MNKETTLKKAEIIRVLIKQLYNPTDVLGQLLCVIMAAALSFKPIMFFVCVYVVLMFDHSC